MRNQIAHEIDFIILSGRRHLRGEQFVQRGGESHHHETAIAKGVISMGLLGWALIFLIVALVAALLGFSGVARASTGIAKVLFGVFLIVFLVLLILGLLS